MLRREKFWNFEKMLSKLPLNYKKRLFYSFCFLLFTHPYYEESMLRIVYIYGKYVTREKGQNKNQACYRALCTSSICLWRIRLLFWKQPRETYFTLDFLRYLDLCWAFPRRRSYCALAREIYIYIFFFTWGLPWILECLHFCRNGSYFNFSYFRSDTV